MRGIARFFRWVGSLYLKLLGGVFGLLASSLLVGVLAFLIAWPLWYFSSHSPGIYSLVTVLIALTALFLFFIRKGKDMEKEELLGIAKKGGLFVLFLLLLLLFVIFLSTSKLFAGVLTFLPLSLCGALIFSQSR
jgi:hypothetical protein